MGRRELVHSAVVLLGVVLLGACKTGATPVRPANPGERAWHVAVFDDNSSARFVGTLTESGDYWLAYGVDGIDIVRAGDAVLVESSPGSGYFYEMTAAAAMASYVLPSEAEIAEVLQVLAAKRDVAPVSNVDGLASVLAAGHVELASAYRDGQQLNVSGRRIDTKAGFRFHLLRTEQANFDPPTAHERTPADESRVKDLLAAIART